MQDTELVNLWKSSDKKLEENLRLNKRNAQRITELRLQSMLSKLRPMKIAGVIAGIVWVVFVDTLIVRWFSTSNAFFLCSAIFQVVLTKLAIGIYLYQLILLQRMDIGGPIVETQIALARLRASTLWVVRLLFLQLPAWTTFYWNEEMLQTGTVWLYGVQLFATLVFFVAAIWLFVNIRYENRDKKWFRYLFGSSEWTPIVNAMEFVEELRAFRTEVK